MAFDEDLERAFETITELWPSQAGRNAVHGVQLALSEYMKDSSDRGASLALRSAVDTYRLALAQTS